jgi:hypothetical protein
MLFSWKRIKIHRSWIAGLFLAWLLAGCSVNQATPAVTPIVALPQATSTNSKLPQAPTEEAAQPGAVETVDPNQPPVPEGCTVVSKQFSPEPTLQSIFPAVSESDWSQGPEAAALTIIEYGDFQ